MADAVPSMAATLLPVIIGGAIALAGTWLGPWVSERHKEKQEKKKIRASKFEELVTTIYEFDHWLDKERDAAFAGEDAKQGVSPFAKLEAIAAVHFPQFDALIQKVDQETNNCTIWINQMRVKVLTNTLGSNALDGYDEIIKPYVAARNRLLAALKKFAHKEFQ